MAKFRFRLATLQKLRVARRDELRGKLAEAYQAQQLLANQRGAVQAELETLEISRRDAIRSGITDVNRLLETQRYQSVLRGQLSTLEEQGKLLEVETCRRRQAVVEADRQVRVLEKLHDRRLREHQHKLALAEIKEMDEIATRSTEALQL